MNQIPSACDTLQLRIPIGSYDTRAETVITLFCNDIIFQEIIGNNVPSGNL